MPSVRLVLAGLLLTATAASAAPFVPNNLVISRVGDGSGTLSGSSAAVFLDEYSLAGSPAGNSIALPTAASGSNFAFTLGGTSTSQGFLTRSADGRFLTLFGYDAPAGTTGPASNASFRGRTIAVVDNNGNVNTSNRFEAGGMTPRSVVTVDGSAFYTSGDGGAGPSGSLRYTTAGSASNGTLLTTTTTTNMRVANIANGQLYVSAATGVGGDFRGVIKVGTGLPTAAGSFDLLPGMGRLGSSSSNGNSESSYDFLFADSTTLYVADDSAAASGGGVQKWSFNGSTWAKVWTVNTAGATGARSITGRKLADGSVELYAIASNATTDLFRILDSGSGTPSATYLASAPANTFFRGVEFTPEPTTLTALIGAMGLVRRRRA